MAAEGDGTKNKTDKQIRGEDLEYIQKHHCRISAVGSLQNGKHPTYHPVLPQEPSTSHFWTPILHNSAFDSYLFYSNAGGGFLHLNTADSTLTLSGSSGIDEHAWVVVEEVSLDVGNFTFVNLFSNAHLAVGQNEEQTVPVRLTGAPESYNATWIPVRLEDGYYRFQTQIDSGKLLKADGTALTVGTATDDSTKWTVKMDEQSGGYSLKNKSTGTILADINGTLSLVTEPALPNASHLWKPVDFFALQAAPEDRVEFALHHLQSGKYLQYGSVFSSTSDGALTAESFNVVVDQTVADSSQSSGYTAQTRSVCQRFTFEKVGTGDNAYYHILPYLRLQTDAANSDTIEIKGSYRSEYRLGVVNGAVRVVQIPVTNGEAEDPTSGRWLLQQTAGGKYLIKNVSTGTYLNMENNAVCLTQQQPRSTLWTLKAISLAMEKDYQQYTNTCGAASGKMVVNYLAAYWKASMLQNGAAPKVDDDAFIEQFEAEMGESYTTEIEGITKTVNRYLDEQHQYTHTYGEKNNTLQHMLSQSLKGFFPAIINIKPHKNLKDNPTIDSEQLPVFGYGYDANSDNGHYFVVKGLYYNSDTKKYDSIINETHYKFGAHPLGKYGSTEQVYRICNNIGGRDLVVEFSMLHQVYLQRHMALMHVA